jgi:hypothetical protein
MNSNKLTIPPFKNIDFTNRGVAKDRVLGVLAI